MPTKFQNYLNEVHTRTRSASSVIPAQRSAFKEGYSFSNKPFAEQLEIWDYIWNHATASRAKTHAFFFVEQHIPNKELHEAIKNTCIGWQEQISGWGLCDALAKIYTKLLESYPGEVYELLAKWNKDENLWKRRQSVVSLLYYSRTKRTYPTFEQIVALVSPLLTDGEYYVQKGIGWTLRELHTVYPERSLPYLLENIHDISSIAFTIAVEKMDAANKENLKELRKSGRKTK